MSQTIEVSLTITRLHKVIERIKALISEKSALVTSASEQFVNLATAVSMIPRLRVLGASAIPVLDEVAALYELQAKLRTVVSHMNEKLGVSDLLAQLDAQAKLLKLKRGLIPAATAIYVADLERHCQLLKDRDGKTAYETVEACGLTAEQVADLQEDIRVLQASSYALSDKLSVLNATQVKVTLPEDLAKQFGLL